MHYCIWIWIQFKLFFPEVRAPSEVQSRMTPCTYTQCFTPLFSDNFFWGQHSQKKTRMPRVNRQMKIHFPPQNWPQLVCRSRRRTRHTEIPPRLFTRWKLTLANVNKRSPASYTFTWTGDRVAWRYDLWMHDFLFLFLTVPSRCGSASFRTHASQESFFSSTLSVNGLLRVEQDRRAAIIVYHCAHQATLWHYSQ